MAVHYLGQGARPLLRCSCADREMQGRKQNLPERDSSLARAVEVDKGRWVAKRKHSFVYEFAPFRSDSLLNPSSFVLGGKSQFPRIRKLIHVLRYEDMYGGNESVMDLGECLYPWEKEGGRWECEMPPDRIPFNKVIWQNEKYSWRRVSTILCDLSVMIDEESHPEPICESCCAWCCSEFSPADPRCSKL
jgi:hypothetical protein